MEYRKKKKENSTKQWQTQFIIIKFLFFFLIIKFLNKGRVKRGLKKGVDIKTGPEVTYKQWWRVVGMNGERVL